ncbi:MAG: FkbM family methyltransferase [Lysobacterales bacterium]
MSHRANSNFTPDTRYRIRVLLGHLLYRVGAFRRLLPLYAPAQGKLGARCLAYLDHYLRSVTIAEADLDLAPLGARFACDLNDHMLAPYLRNEAPIYELAEINFFRQQVRSGDHIIDIGANHGFWGITLAKAAGTGSQLQLFEANPTIARRVRRTLSLNPQVNGRIHELAVTDGTSSQISFYRPQDNLSGLGSTVLHDFANERGYLRADDRIIVHARSIDQLMDSGDITGMDLVKIDVEQAEDAVVAGAKRALTHFKPRLLMVETGTGSNATRTLLKLGYQMTALHPDGSESAAPPDHWGNLLFRREAA